MAICKECVHNEVCKYGEKRSNGMYCTEEKCKQFKDSTNFVEVVHGRWVEKIDMVESYLADSTEVFYECSVCECANIGESPYCPNCGAKMMDGGADNG